MQEKTTLNRVITLPLLVFYGTGTILGAGIYALTGEIAGISGMYMPFSFLLSAIIAAFVAFSYAELSGRFPKSAGEAVYVHQAFSQPWLTRLVGLGIAATGIVSAGVMARGFHGYLNEIVQISSDISIICFVTFITIIAVLGISLSVKIAALITIIEISGILLLLYVSRNHLLTITEHWEALIPPLSWPVWQNIIFGAFLAFYAFIGFEDMVNVAEEVINPERNLPVGIIMCLVITTCFYVLVGLAVVLTLPLTKLAGHAAPFVLIIKENSNIPVVVISLVSMTAIVNGALVQIIMASRVIYGLAENGLLPGYFKFIHPRTQTPVTATGFFSLILLGITLWLPIAALAKMTSFFILTIFALVNLGLCTIKIRERQVRNPGYLRVPILVPAIGFLLCLSFIAIQFK